MPAPDATSKTHTGYRWPLHALAILLALSTFTLIGFGGQVTSLDAGLAVPDWPGTFGYNMFLAPLDKWFYQVGTFWEHSHRLIGSWVGLITLALSIGLAIWGRRTWLRWMGVPLTLLVVAQGLMGGFRVTEQSTFLAFIHGIIGQLFFAVIIFTLVAVGPQWSRRVPRPKSQRNWAQFVARFAAWTLVTTLAIQLALGAAVRHFDAEYVIPDAPLSYGALVPPMTQTQLDKAILDLPDDLIDRVPPNTKVGKVHLHFTHRAWAVVVCVAAGLAGWLALVILGKNGEIFAPLLYVACLLASQIMLGIMTVWADINPSLATLHQSIGALVLAASVWFAARVYMVSALKLPDLETTTPTPESQPSQQQPLPAGSPA